MSDMILQTNGTAAGSFDLLKTQTCCPSVVIVYNPDPLSFAPVRGHIGLSIRRSLYLARDGGSLKIADDLHLYMYEGDNSILLLASVYLGECLESAPHNPTFLFGAKLVCGSCKG